MGVYRHRTAGLLLCPSRRSRAARRGACVAPACRGAVVESGHYLDADISTMTVHSAKGSSGIPFSVWALRASIGLE